MQAVPRSRARGFTLIELLVTVAIVGLLASVAAPLMEVSAQRTRETDLRHSLQQLREAIDAYKRAVDEKRVASPIDASGYPPTLKLLAEGVPDARSPKPAKIYFLRRIPRDPFATDPSVPPEAGWETRSYESPPEEFKPGRDVYDVRSKSDAKGLNGVPYKDW